MKPGFALLAAVAFVLTALITLNLKHAGENEIGAESHVLSYMSETQFQDGLEWRAISGRIPMQDVRLQIAASRKREGAHLADSVGVGLSSAATVDITKATDRYQQGVDLEMGLLGLGSTQAALSHERRPLTGAHLDRARPTSADCGEPVRP